MTNGVKNILRLTAKVKTRH